MSEDTEVSQSSPRILFISHAYLVGVNQGKLNAIAQTGKVRVGLLVPSNWKALEWNRSIELERPYPNIQIYSASVAYTGRVGAHFYAPWKIWQVLADFQPDLVQVEAEVFSLCAFETAILTRLAGKPLVIFGWENMERKLPMFRRLTCQFVLNTVSTIVAGNQDGANVMRSWGYTGKIEVMPQLGVDTSLFSPQLRTAGTDRVFQIGFLGRLVPEKGIDWLLDAVCQLCDKGLNCRVILCGSGASESALREQAEKLQIDDLITWRGAVRHEEAPTEIAKFDVLVLPSRSIQTWREQFGHVLIEAMAMGIPVIGSTCGEIPNVIGREDLVFTEGDSQGLADILARMICEPAWREEIGRYGCDRVQQQYSHERIAQKLIDLWKSMLDRVSKE